MPSKASTWASDLRKREACVRETRQVKPSPILLRIDINHMLSLEVDDGGQPRIKMESGNWMSVETDKLIAFCRQVIDTFSEPTP